MKHICTKVSLAIISLLLSVASLCAQTRQDSYDQALSLYRNGMYERARSIFESIDSPDALSEGYALLCALKMRSEGVEDMIPAYEALYPESSLFAQIHYQNALNLFDDGDYRAARREFGLFRREHLYKEQIQEYVFKSAYCDFGLDDYDSARDSFTAVEKMPFSDYTAPSRYAIGYIDYSRKDFESAIKWLELAAKDPRFKDYADYYILESKFMQKDYDYVVQNGPALFENVPEERKAHLARIISESFLVKGDSANARRYYDSYVASEQPQTRTDYFYAGSLLYSLGDWKGAVDNYSMMSERTDSLGQIASYQMADALIQLKNKVAALDAFKQASQLRFDPDIREDAFFNYAKLSFDLNHDTQVFENYIKEYAGSKRGDSIYSYMALAYLYNHDYAAAVEAYDKIDELTPDMRGNYMKANYLRANQLIQGGSWRDAESCLKAAGFYAGKNDPLNYLSRYWLAQSYYHNGNYDEARGILNELYNLSALEYRDEGKTVAYDMAYCYFDEGDYASAARWFTTYIGYPDGKFRKDAMTRLADCSFIRKDYVKAAAAYEDVLKSWSDPDDVYPYYQLGLAYGLSEKFDKKAQALSKVKSASPDALLYSDAFYELGRTYVVLKDEANAISCFNRLRTTSKDNSYVARALIELGMIYRNRTEYDKALEYYKQVVETLPSSTWSDDALLAIESIYQTKGEPDAYFAYIDSVGGGARKTEGEKELVYFNSAEEIFAGGNYQKALVLLQQYVDNYPEGSKRAEAEFYMAECYRSLGQKEKACDGYAKVLELVDSGSFAELSWLNYSNLSYSLEHFADAYKGYSSLLSLSQIAENKAAAREGRMRSAFKARSYADAISAADDVLAAGAGTDLTREAQWTKAKSWLSLSRREEAFAILRELADAPGTDEGAEAAYLLIQDALDQGEFAQVEKMVYAFAEKADGQDYWLAKAFIALGDSFAEQDNLTQAKATFESIASGYEPYGPEDDVMDNVNMRLEKLSKMI